MDRWDKDELTKGKRSTNIHKKLALHLPRKKYVNANMAKTFKYFNPKEPFGKYI